MAKKPLTQDQLAKVEEKLKTYMANKQSWVKRYGKDAEFLMRGRAISTVKKETEQMNKQKLKELIKTSLMKEASNSEIESSVKNMINNLEYDMDDFKISSDNPNKIELRYQRWARLPEDLRSSLENEFNVEEYELEDEDTLPQYSYIISSKMNEGKKSFPDLTGDGKVTRADILKGRGVELNEDWGGSDQYVMNQSIHKDLGSPTTFPSPFSSEFESAVEEAVDFYWDEFPEYQTDRDGLINKAKKLYYRAFFPEQFEGFMKMFGENINEAEKPSMFVTGGNINPELRKKVEQFVKGVAKYYDYSVDDAFLAIMTILKGGLAKEGVNEDLDLGHQDNEPHMIKGELYRIGKYAMELYKMVDGFEGPMEVDFPAWWQSKITTSMNNMVSAKHYLDFELKEPSIDAMVSVASDEEVIDENISKEDILSRDLYKLKDKIQPAFFDKIRKFINMGSLEDAEYLLNRVKGQMKEKGLDEKKLTKAETNKKEEIVKGMKKDFKGSKEAMYAIATDKAKKVAETIAKKLKND